VLFFQITYKEEVGKYLVDKQHVSDGVGTEQFLYYILILCAAFFTLSIGMTAYMLIRRKCQNRKKAFDNILIEKYQEFLSGFLILPVDDSFLGISKESRLEYRLDPKDISDPYRRKLLAKEIYQLKKNLSGQQENQLSNYFFGLGLQNEVEKMLDSNSWDEKMKAIQMVQSFNIFEYLPKIHKYINDANRDLAIHAIMAIMTIEKSLDILFDVNQKLNNWESHKIVNVIKKLNLSPETMSQLKENVKEEDSLLHQLSIGLIEKKASILTFQEN